MSFFAELWLPILLSSVLCFILSSLAWTVLPHHDKDYKAVPDHDALAAKLSELGLQPGVYMFPMADTKQAMRTPEFQQVYTKGPWGTLTLWPAKASMGRNLVLTFIYFLIVSLLIGYVGYESLGIDVRFAKVFQITGTIGVLAYCASSLLGAIWFAVPLRNVLANLIDGLAYGLATGCVFGLLWPASSTIITGG